MENIDNMGSNSLEALSRDNLTKKGKRKLAREIVCGAVSLTCLAVGLIFSAIFPSAVYVPALLYTAGFLIEGIPVFAAAIKGIFTRNLTNAMEILVAIAIIACFFSDQLILAVLIPLILNIVHFLEERSIMGGRDVIDGLRKMQQNTAILLGSDGSESEVDAKHLKKGQRVVIRPGAGVPIDGTVISGETHIDQSSMTGEPEPFHAKPGERVYAGTVNLDGRIVVEVDKEFVDTSFSKILGLLERSENISIPESRLIDRFMTYYIPFVLAVAAGVALITSDVSKAIAILVVSCPCGQMLVNSAPMIAALSVATKHGILIKNSKFIEEMTEVDAVVFDKTGTVTEGRLAMTAAIPSDGHTDEELIRSALSVAYASTHPVSRAVLAAGEGMTYDLGLIVREVAGKGVEGRSADGDTVVRFGKASWLSEMGCAIPDGFCDCVVGSVSCVEVNGFFLGCLGFSDTVRPGADKCIDELRRIGVERAVMLTGDRREPAERIGNEIGIDEVCAQLLPQEKLAKLGELKKEHRVLAVGDGINDALALREADVGVVMGAMGSDLAIQSADIALMNNNLENVPFAIRLAKYTRRVIYQNLAISIGISAVMIALSAFGVISALAGTVLHNCGAFAVLLNSSKILRKKYNDE